MSACEYPDNWGCESTATYTVKWEGKTYRVCDAHSDDPDVYERRPIKPEPEPEPKQFTSFFQVRDGLKTVVFKTLNSSEIAVFWQYLMNTMYTAKDYGMVLPDYRDQEYLAKMTGLSVSTVKRARQTLHERGYIIRVGRRVSTAPGLRKLAALAD
jgi:hypothetical protein